MANSWHHQHMLAYTTGVGIAGLIDGACGMIAGLITGQLLAFLCISGRRSVQGSAMLHSCILSGVFLGWQAVGTRATADTAADDHHSSHLFSQSRATSDDPFFTGADRVHRRLENPRSIPLDDRPHRMAVHRPRSVARLAADDLHRCCCCSHCQGRPVTVICRRRRIAKRTHRSDELVSGHGQCRFGLTGNILREIRKRYIIRSISS